jgi:hypothetical protein
MFMRTLLLAILGLGAGALGWAAPKPEALAVTSPLHVLDAQLGSQVDEATEPYKSGQLDVGKVQQVVTDLGQYDPSKVYIIHLLRWGDTQHTTVQFQKWYAWQPRFPDRSFYLLSDQKLFEDTFIAGAENLRFIFIHLNHDLGDPSESIGPVDADHPDPWVKPNVQVSYNITISPQPTQFHSDVLALLKLVTGINIAAVVPHPGYWSVADFHCDLQPSSIKIAPVLPTLQKSPTTVAGSSTSNAATPVNVVNADTYSNTYTNEKPGYFGLSFAVPVSKYKDVTYQSSNGTFVPASVTKQNVYATFDLYVPAAVPGLMNFRWIPHPFVGLQLQGKVFRDPMAGIAFGLPWAELYAGAVFDTENQSSPTSGHKLVIKGSFGVKISVTAAVKALGKLTGGSSQ